MTKKFIIDQIRNNWSEPFVRIGNKNEAISYGRTAENIIYLSSFLKEIGLEKGDKIAIIGQNTYNWIVTYLTCLIKDYILVPLSKSHKEYDIYHLVNHSRSTVLMADQKVLNRLDFTLMPFVQYFVSLHDFKIMLSRPSSLSAIYARPFIYTKKGERRLEETLHHVYCKPSSDDYHNSLFTEQDENNIAMIPPTSGTEKDFNPVMLTHKNLMSALSEMELKFSEEFYKENIIAMLPFDYYHLFEILLTMKGGSCLIIPTKGSIQEYKELAKQWQPKVALFDAISFHSMWYNIVEEKVFGKWFSRFYQNPLILWIAANWIKRKLNKFFGKQIEEIIVINDQLKVKIKNILKMINYPVSYTYGLVETTYFVGYSKYNNPFNDYGIINNVHVQLDSEDPTVVAGEILLKGDSISLGYDSIPKHYSNRSVNTLNKQHYTEKGWLKTGDIGLQPMPKKIELLGKLTSVITDDAGIPAFPENYESILSVLPFINDGLLIARNDKIYYLVIIDKIKADAQKLTYIDIIDKMEAYRKKVNNFLPFHIDHFIIYSSDDFARSTMGKIKRNLYI